MEEDDDAKKTLSPAEARDQCFILKENSYNCKLRNVKLSKSVSNARLHGHISGESSQVVACMGGRDISKLREMRSAAKAYRKEKDAREGERGARRHRYDRIWRAPG